MTEKSYSLTLSQSHLQVVLNALTQRPWIEANPVLTEIETQVKAQVAPLPGPVPQNETKPEPLGS